VERSGADLGRSSRVWCGLQFFRVPPFYIFSDAVAHRSGWPSKVVVDVYDFHFHRWMCLCPLCGLVGLSIPRRPFGNMI